MSHMVTIETQFGNGAALEAACSELGLESPVENQTVKLYSGTRTGTAVRLKGWKYPIVIDEQGTVHFDNYGGSWGKEARLNELRQAYSVAVVQQTMGMGWAIQQHKHEDGTILMTLTR